ISLAAAEPVVAENEIVFNEEPMPDEALWMDIRETDAARVFARLLEHVCALGVSDLFFCSEEHVMTVRARHLGILQKISWLPLDLGRRCLVHIKTLASLDIAERRRPMDGRWIYRRPNNQVADLRINTLPTLYGEDCTLRILDRQNRLLGLESLGLL